MGTEWTKAPNFVQLFLSIYKVILRGEPSPNTTLIIKKCNYNKTPKFNVIVCSLHVNKFINFHVHVKQCVFNHLQLYYIT